MDTSAASTWPLWTGDRIEISGTVMSEFRLILCGSRSSSLGNKLDTRSCQCAIVSKTKSRH